MNDLILADPVSPVTPARTSWRVANIGGGTAKMDLAKQWYARPADERFLSLEALIRSKRTEWDESTSLVMKTTQIEAFAPEPKTVDDMNRLFFGLNPGGLEVSSTHWAFGQVCSLVGAPSQYLREQLPSQIAADALNWGLRRNRKLDEVKVFYRSNGGHIMRAVNGPDFGRIPDFEIIEALQRVAEGGHWKVPGIMDWSTMTYNANAPVTLDTTTLFASDRDMFVFLVDDLHPIKIGEVFDRRTGKMEDDIVFRGFYVTQSEVGAKALKIAVFYLRALCCNRIMWGVEGFEEINIRHSKYAPDRWLDEAYPALESYANRGASRLQEGVEKAKAAKLVKDDEEALAFLNDRNFNRAQSKRILEITEAEEGHPARSAWDFAQGITAYARDQINQDTRLEFELGAKRILDKVAA